MSKIESNEQRGGAAVRDRKDWTATESAPWPTDVAIGDSALAQMRSRLPMVAERTIAAVIAQVPEYAHLDESNGATLERAVEGALSDFLDLAGGRRGHDPSAPKSPAIDAAYALGRGEARSGRSMDALQAAYRIGARTAWQELAGAAVSEGLAAVDVVSFAELVFAYIEELSMGSGKGHAYQMSLFGRAREQQLEELAASLAAGADVNELIDAAEQAEWEPPVNLVAVVLPQSRMRGVLSRVDSRTLQPVVELPDLSDEESAAVLFVPSESPAERARLIRSLGEGPGVVGSSRPWMEVAESLRRASLALEAGLGTDQSLPVDADDYLPELLVSADAEMLADLRARALAPMSDLRPDTAARLSETLQSWLLHSGRRDEVAADLVVHPQTVRYRMNQVRELYGDKLTDPRTVLELTIALGAKIASAEEPGA